MKIHEFINETNWTQRVLCRDNLGGTSSWPFSRNVCKWCLTGMVIFCYSYDERIEVFNKIKSKVGDHIPSWNDRPERTWEDVRDLAKELDI